MRRIIGIVSGKGGVGKTVTSINLGMALHSFGEEVLVVDMDLNNPNLGLHLGPHEFPISLNTILKEDMNVLEALHIHPSGLKIIPASISLWNLHTDPLRIRHIFDELDGFIIFDCAPGYGREVITSLETCDEVIVVTNPTMQALTGALRLIEVVKEMHKSIRGVVVNNIHGRYHRRIDSNEIEGICDAPVIGTIPHDINIDKSVSSNTPLVAYNHLSPAALEYKKIACGISGKDFTKPRLIRLQRLLYSLKK